MDIGYTSKQLYSAIPYLVVKGCDPDDAYEVRSFDLLLDLLKRTAEQQEAQERAELDSAKRALGLFHSEYGYESQDPFEVYMAEKIDKLERTLNYEEVE